MKADNEYLSQKVRDLEKISESNESWRQAFEKKNFEMEQFRIDTDRKSELISNLKQELNQSLKETEKLKKNFEFTENQIKNELNEKDRFYRSKVHF